MVKWINHKGEERDVRVDSWCPFINEKYTGIRIEWSGSNGWGQYDIIFNGDIVEGYSEYMDKDEDKRFIKALFEDIINNIVIKE